MNPAPDFPYLDITKKNQNPLETMKSRILLLSALSAQLLHAQISDPETTKPVYPKYQTEAELLKAAGFKNNPQYDFNAQAFPAQFTVPGEFEESQAVVIQWPYPSSSTSSYAKLWSKLARGIQEAGAPVWIVVDNFSDTTTAKNYMNANGTVLFNYKFINKVSDAYWARDWGPIGFYTGPNDDLAFNDAKYYPGRGNDDVIPAYIASQMGIVDYKTNLRIEGGNFMTDGFNKMVYSTRLLDNNQSELGWSNASTRDTIKRVYQMNDVIELQKLVCDGGTGHIDMYVKYMDEQTIIISEYPASVTASDKTTINNNTSLLQTLNSVYGRPYKIIKMPMPTTNTGTYNTSCTSIGADARGFINGITVNKTFIMPIFSGYNSTGTMTGNIAGDSAAVQRYRKLLPGYRIFPVDARLLTQQGGAIHCITMQIPANNPVRFWHPSVEGLQPVLPNYHIVSKITNRSGIAQANCLWRLKGTSSWNTVSLSDSSGYFIADIPNMSFTPSDTIEYFLDATSNNGKYMTKPIVAPAGGYYTFYTSGVFTSTDLFNEFPETYLFSSQPNPANSYSDIAVYLKNNASLTIELNDMLGKSMTSINDNNAQKGISSYRMNTEPLVPGVYFYTLYLNGERYKTRKMVISR